MFSTSICLISHDITQRLLKGMNEIGSCPSQFCLVFSTICLVSHDKGQCLLTSMTDVSSCPSVVSVFADEMALLLASECFEGGVFSLEGCFLASCLAGHVVL